MTRKKKQVRTMIFDDVFRTMAQKLPQLMVALINEAFATDYAETDIEAQHRNEYMTENGRIITDSIYQIGGRLYHIECQSTKDGRMVVRMFEYDCAIAIEQALKNGTPYEIRFPQSCVLYLRDDGSGQDGMKMRVIMPNWQECTYSARIIRVSDYTGEEIFQKKLLCMLPYYILRYENELDAIEGSAERTKELLEEYRGIVARLQEATGAEARSDVYVSLVRMISEISEHVLRNRRKLKEEVDKVMGGRVLELESERLIKKGRREGRVEGRVEGRQEGESIGEARGERSGRVKTLLSLVEDHFLTREQAIERSGLSAEEFDSIAQTLSVD